MQPQVTGVSLRVPAAEIDESDGIAIFVGLRPEHARYGNREIGGRTLQGALGHFERHRFIHAAEAVEDALRNPERARFVRLRVRDETAVKNFCGTISLRKCRRNQARGAGFRRDDRCAAFREAAQHRVRSSDQIGRHARRASGPTAADPISLDGHHVR